jgi:DNA-binding transcriptional LysR family regulator
MLIALRLLLSDRVLNPFENKIDVAIRIGPLPDSSIIATRIGSVRVVACASPEYLAARGHPESPDDLSSHDCIRVDETGVPRKIGAQLEHQPTRESVEHAKKQAQAQILMVVTQAEALDSEGRRANASSPRRNAARRPPT